MGALSRRKGQVFERELVHLFREAMPGTDIKRGLQCRGEETADVDCPVFWIEAKHHHRVNIQAAMDQARAAAPKGKIPVAVCKDDRRPAVVTMDLEDFLELVREWWAKRDILIRTTVQGHF